MRINVTGARGFVGQHLVCELTARGHVVGTPGPVVAAYGCDLVLHAGACVGRERCSQSVDQAIAKNVASTLHLAEACARLGTSIVYVSSAEVYEPRNIYALTKHWAEEACRLALPTELLTIARLGAQYGPGARLGADTLSNFIAAAMRGGKLYVYRDTWRSWTYVGDTARALTLIAEASVGWREHGKHSLEPAIYDVETDDRRTLYDVAQEVVRLVGDGTVEEVTAPAGYAEIPRLNTRSLRDLGWEPQVSFEEGLLLTAFAVAPFLAAA